ncbi:MAG: flagellar assembly protein FliW [Epsilonproteobacteria bacterium]|nr:flagellar assembly protein FliW [Campylobacterota bacterium]
MKYKVVLPILGFENEDEFELQKVNDTFYKLIGKDVNFTLINPFLLRDDYDFEISDKESEALKLDENKKLLVLNIVTVEEPFLNSTVNFAAPLIFNEDDKIMGQVILDKYNYSLAEPLSNYIKEKK